ncbi:hypothetical protein D9M68_976600 [compost metagenome]
MSWYSGNQLTQDSPGLAAKPRLMLRSLASRLAWLTITPFGALVDPEVYCKNARVSAPISCG